MQSGHVRCFHLHVDILASDRRGGERAEKSLRGLVGSYQIIDVGVCGRNVGGCEAGHDGWNDFTIEWEPCLSACRSL